MTLSSMTGFARVSGHLAIGDWQWELKSVNGKALDLRLRLPPGLDHLEAALRASLSNHIKRGNLQANLTINAAAKSETLSINHQLLEELTAAAETVRQKTGGPPLRAEQLLALRGVVEVSEQPIGEDDAASRDAALVAGFDQAVRDLAASRNAEGQRLHAVITDHLARITELTKAARDNPARKPEAIRARLAELVQRLLEQSSSFDAERLHQEAVLVATRADIQEELDRLQSHLEAAASLLKSKEPVGRKFDFLAQEFNREANTLCSKAGDRALSAIGLDLKTVIDQMREQVQNIE